MHKAPVQSWSEGNSHALKQLIIIYYTLQPSLRIFCHITSCDTTSFTSMHSTSLLLLSGLSLLSQVCAVPVAPVTSKDKVTGMFQVGCPTKDTNCECLPPTASSTKLDIRCGYVDGD